MLIKIMTLFLVAMGILAIFAKYWVPAAKRRVNRRGGRCSACGRPRIGPGPCPCGKAPKS